MKSTSSINGNNKEEKESLIVPLGVEESPRSPKPTVEAMKVEFLKLIWGAGGIYAAYLYYGSLHEDVFNYEDANGNGFKQAWFLTSLEAAMTAVAGAIGLRLVGSAGKLPQRDFMISGCAQVSAKAFTSLALANGLSYPVATLAKSAKMAPVMMGSLVLGGTFYSAREYLQVLAIITGTVIVSMGKKKGGKSSSSFLGLCFILLSLTMDGVVAGTQKRLKANMSKVGVKPKPYDFMFYTNVYMAISGTIVSLLLGELVTGVSYCLLNPAVTTLIFKFCLCSIAGQSFIFYTIAHFDPLVCSTVTTTRKIFTVLLSIFLKGHQLDPSGWAGISIAFSGIFSEALNKYSAASKKKSPN